MTTRRLFVALRPPAPVLEAAAARVAALRGAAGPAAADVRWVAPGNVHLTLRFLGGVPAGRVPDVEAAVRGAAAAAARFTLALGGPGAFPSARRPRVLWLGVGGEVAALSALAADLGRHLAPLGFPPEERAFSPHLTVGRARDPRGAPRLAGALAGADGAAPVPWAVDFIALVESHLSPAGPRYEDLLRAPLATP
ncbi:MAG: RNA 2',3'-cyclic phosphodiesterase [Anaeromyxobacteraceae bacterium]